MTSHSYADACDDGISFILQNPNQDTKRGSTTGGLIRDRDQGHFVTIAGRGGTGKSMLALQFVTDLLNQSDTADVSRVSKGSNRVEPAAFYFTLEASPLELARQLRDLRFGQKRYFSRATDDPIRGLTSESLDWSCRSLHIHAIPSPIEDLTVLIRQVRQTIANTLATEPFNDLVGIVIDPLGGVRFRKTLRTDLSSLKHLADSHRTFLFLLAEDHIYEQHRSIEHYSQTVLQLRHKPAGQPSREIFVQKARSQPFLAGNHQVELLQSGVTVFPSVEAQSAYAHEKRVNPRKPKSPPGKRSPFLKDPKFDRLTEMADGSVVFLMGPPGTFKQRIATNFATAPRNASSLFISFKAEQSAVEEHVKEEGVKIKVVECPKNNESSRVRNIAKNGERKKGKRTIWFIDARSPLSTPQEILSRVRITMNSPLQGPPIQRAVVWGLRRLADMPNFSGSTAVQFLEALVTLLQAERTTCLLVDWPDIEKGNTLPIVDLSQYILLTRLCYSRSYLEAEKRNLGHIADQVWSAKEAPQPENAVLLRVQRDDKGFHRDVGFSFIRHREKKKPVIKPLKGDFETCWDEAGQKWEKDPGLS